MVSRLFLWRAKFLLSKTMAGRSQDRILVTAPLRGKTSLFSLSCGTHDRGGANRKFVPLEVDPPPRLNPCSPPGRGGKTTFLSATRGPQHAARGPQHKCGPRVTRAALRNFAGHITMLIFGPSAAHISYPRGPHLARGPHFLHH